MINVNEINIEEELNRIFKEVVKLMDKYVEEALIG